MLKAKWKKNSKGEIICRAYFPDIKPIEDILIIT